MKNCFMLLLWRIMYWICMKLGRARACWWLYWHCKYGNCKSTNLFNGLQPAFRKGI